MHERYVTFSWSANGKEFHQNPRNLNRGLDVGVVNGSLGRGEGTEGENTDVTVR